MRIIAGTLGGRQFKDPAGHRTHPMNDKGRNALFNALGDISGLAVLDPFGGTGALGFEAVSRGAAHATTIDKDRNAQRHIEENIKLLGLGKQVKLIKASANAWLSTTDQAFDLVLLDPPFEELQPALLTRLAECTKVNGVVDFSLPPKAEVNLPANFEFLTNKAYGDNQLVFYRRLR
jgi:16S rRNA (guanine966-N2)-methyltransferase